MQMERFSSLSQRDVCVSITLALLVNQQGRGMGREERTKRNGRKGAQALPRNSVQGMEREGMVSVWRALEENQPPRRSMDREERTKSHGRKRGQALSRASEQGMGKEGRVLG